MLVRSHLNLLLLFFLFIFPIFAIARKKIEKSLMPSIATEEKRKNKIYPSSLPKKVRSNKKDNSKQKKVTSKKNVERPMHIAAKDRLKRKEWKKKRQADSKRTLSTMSLDELRKTKNELIEFDNKDGAIRYLEKMIPLCTDMKELEKIMIELADLYYQMGKLTKAFTMYNEFVNLYPGSKKVEYALYKAIVCKFDEICDAERDQTATQETIKLAQKFLERTDVFINYKDKVEDILKKCNERLFENELTIFNFYLFNRRFVAATKRLESIQNEYLKILPDCEPRLILLETELAQALDNKELVAQKQDELITKFPDYVTHVASTVSKKKRLSERF